MAQTPRVLTDGQRAYETRRAVKAGMSLDKWLAVKDREAAAEARISKAAAPKPEKPPGLLKRLLERARKPIT